MHWMRRGAVILGLAALLATGFMTPLSSRAAFAREGFNDQYIYATTRSVSDMDVNPALKLTLFPATLVLDTAFLPFAVIAGFVT